MPSPAGSAARLTLLRRAAVLLRAPRTRAEGALLKSIALSDSGHAATRERVAPWDATSARPPLDTLRELPAGTLGHALAAFCDRNAIALLQPTDDFVEAGRLWPLPTRYAATHDLRHALLGEEADPPGEVAVYAFACGQRVLRVHWLAWVVGMCVWSLRRPWTIKAILDAARRGYARGRQAVFVLGLRLETRLTDRLEDLRRELRVT